jgi:hypothetical protein
MPAVLLLSQRAVPLCACTVLPQYCVGSNPQLAAWPQASKQYYTAVELANALWFLLTTGGSVCLTAGGFGLLLQPGLLSEQAARSVLRRLIPTTRQADKPISSSSIYIGPFLAVVVGTIVLALK